MPFTTVEAVPEKAVLPELNVPEGMSPFTPAVADPPNVNPALAPAFMPLRVKPEAAPLLCTIIEFALVPPFNEVIEIAPLEGFEILSFERIFLAVSIEEVVPE